jgi:hypothetical protein
MIRALGFLAALSAAPAMAEMSAEDLAKLAQNPVGNVISAPFQNNTNLDYGPERGTQNILNIQPVIAISINNDCNTITRTILPVIWMRSLGEGIGSTTGIGDTVFTALLSPANPGKWIWGAGQVVQAATNSSAELGNGNWGLWPIRCAAAYGPWQSLGLWCLGQQYLVADQQPAGWLLQQRDHSTLTQ